MYVSSAEKHVTLSSTPEATPGRKWTQKIIGTTAVGIFTTIQLFVAPTQNIQPEQTLPPVQPESSQVIDPEDCGPTPPMPAQARPGPFDVSPRFNDELQAFALNVSSLEVLKDRAKKYNLHLVDSRITWQAYDRISRSKTPREAIARINSFTQKHFNFRTALTGKATQEIYKGSHIFDFSGNMPNPEETRQQIQAIAYLTTEFEFIPKELIAISKLKEIKIHLGNIKETPDLSLDAFADHDAQRIVAKVDAKNWLKHELGHLLDSAYCRIDIDKDSGYVNLNPPGFEYNFAAGRDRGHRLPSHVWAAISNHFSISSPRENKANNTTSILSNELHCGPTAEQNKKRLLVARWDYLHRGLGQYISQQQAANTCQFEESFIGPVPNNKHFTPATGEDSKAAY